MAVQDRTTTVADYQSDASYSAREALSRQFDNNIELRRPQYEEKNLSRIEWATDVKSALTRAQAEGKPLVVVFQEERCGWCKLFGKELEKASTNSIAQDAIFLRVTPSSNADGKKLAELCKIEGYPSVSVLTVNKGSISPVFKVSGYLESDKFVSSMKNVFAELDKKSNVV